MKVYVFEAFGDELFAEEEVVVVIAEDQQEAWQILRNGKDKLKLNPDKEFALKEEVAIDKGILTTAYFAL